MFEIIFELVEIHSVKYAVYAQIKPTPAYFSLHLNSLYSRTDSTPDMPSYACLPHMKTVPHMWVPNYPVSLIKKQYCLV